MLLGDYRVEVIPDAEFRLDGGAMFGVIPREMWSRVAPPDDRNRIRLRLNCLFIDTGQEKILIETGIGDKWSAKRSDVLGIKRERNLSESLEATAGCTADDVTIVINTHLHFDHAGGNTRAAEGGDPVPSFRNARYFIARSEYEHANAPHERDRASYLPENWEPVEASRQLELKDESYEAVPGLVMETIPGHSRTMQCARLSRGGMTLFGFADLVPTRAHLPLPWIMGYDLYPVETLEAKRLLLPLAALENWICWFYHDAEMPLCTLRADDRGIAVTPFHFTERGSL